MKGIISGFSSHGKVTYLKVEWEKRAGNVIFGFLKELDREIDTYLSASWPEEDPEKDSHIHIEGARFNFDMIFGSEHIHMFITDTGTQNFNLKQKIGKYFVFSKKHAMKNKK
ncbi:MAG: hypothetical protein HY518_01570 [Candidatus Aenigmarchaeota archaeon]|nr:hypothetical protein [Candidatus Aenigmarchaeota archaeon]